jgi:cytoskeleton protein RodZ
MHNLSTAAAMFDLGASLRAARHKRGLELDAVQRELRIRKRYLEALEGERFELLPGEVYTRGFLREYAEFLGLDGSIYVAEYDARFAHHDEPAIAARPTAAPLRRSPALPVVLAVAAALAAAVGLAAWQLSGSGRSTPAAALEAPAVPAAQTQRPAKTARPIAAAAVVAPKPSVTRLVLKASRGDCWVLVRAGSAAGPILYENVVHRGASVSLRTQRPFWMRVGAGTNLDAWVGGKALHGIPYMTGNLLVKA